MKLRKVKQGYFCASDSGLEFYRLRGWRLIVPRLIPRRGLSKYRQYFSTLAEATDYARQLWRPRFLGRALDELHGDGLRLWRDALAGDQQAFLVLLDWIEDNLPSCRADFGDRDRVLKQADRYGLFRPRRRRVAGVK